VPPSLKQDVEAPESSTMVTAAVAELASAERAVAPTESAWTGEALSLRLASLVEWARGEWTDEALRARLAACE